MCQADVQIRATACCRYHGAMWGIISSAPEWIVNDYLLGFNQMLRKKYSKKMEREAAKAKGQ